MSSPCNVETNIGEKTIYVKYIIIPMDLSNKLFIARCDRVKCYAVEHYTEFNRFLGHITGEFFDYIVAYRVSFSQ